MKSILLSLFLSSLAMPAWASSLCYEGFEQGSNSGKWDFGIPTTDIPNSGGDSGAFLHARKLITFFPYVGTSSPQNCFVGNYLAKHVKSVDVAFNVFFIEDAEQVGSLPVTLALWHRVNGKKVAALLTAAHEMSVTDKAWHTTQFIVPTREEWSSLVFMDFENGALSSPPDRSDFLSSIEEVGFYLGDPTLFTLLRTWDVGVDSIALNGDINE